MRNSTREIGFAVVVAAACMVSPTLAASGASGSLRGLDTDHDGTIDLNEIRTAAAAAFNRLDRDRDGTLSGRELRGRMNARELAAEDPDHDGTLTRDEYAATVEKRFKAANRDGDETLDARELGSGPGRALLRLVR